MDVGVGGDIEVIAFSTTALSSVVVSVCINEDIDDVIGPDDMTSHIPVFGSHPPEVQLHVLSQVSSPNVYGGHPGSYMIHTLFKSFYLRLKL